MGEGVPFTIPTLNRPRNARLGGGIQILQLIRAIGERKCHTRNPWTKHYAFQTSCVPCIIHLQCDRG